MASPIDLANLVLDESDNEVAEDDDVASDGLSLPEESIPDLDDFRDDMGYWSDGSGLFHIRLYDRIKEPARSLTVRGAMDVYNQNAFRIGSGQSQLVNLGFGLIVPIGHTAVFSSRHALVRDAGLVVFENVFGSGSYDQVSIRVFNSSRFPWIVRSGDAIALMSTREEHYAPFEFHAEFGSQEEPRREM